MKLLAYSLNIAGILLCFYLYRSLGAVFFIFTAIIPLLTLVILSGLTHARLTLVLMILNLCLSCAGVILMAVVLFTDAAEDYIFAPETTFSFISIFIVIAIFNVLSLKNQG